mmetsp:Transcript_34539/g.75625  ORF Transcript_34539/g.75625 Transcript_34539/m.75625 type:complete len:328 (+) Transcript_34539:604-1587(+)
MGRKEYLDSFHLVISSLTSEKRSVSEASTTKITASQSCPSWGHNRLPIMYPPTSANRTSTSPNSISVPVGCKVGGRLVRRSLQARWTNVDLPALSSPNIKTRIFQTSPSFRQTEIRTRRTARQPTANVSLTQPGTQEVTTTADPPTTSNTAASAKHTNRAATTTDHTTTAATASEANEKPSSKELVRNGLHQGTTRLRVHDGRPTSSGGDDLRWLELASLEVACQRIRTIASRPRPARRRHRAHAARNLVRIVRHRHSLEGRSPASNGPGVGAGLWVHTAATSWPAACMVGAIKSRGSRMTPHEEHGSQPHHDFRSRSSPVARNGFP